MELGSAQHGPWAGLHCAGILHVLGRRNHPQHRGLSQLCREGGLASAGGAADGALC